MYPVSKPARKMLKSFSNLSSTSLPKRLLQPTQTSFVFKRPKMFAGMMCSSERSTSPARRRKPVTKKGLLHQMQRLCRKLISMGPRIPPRRKHRKKCLKIRDLRFNDAYDPP